MEEYEYREPLDENRAEPIDDPDKDEVEQIGGEGAIADFWNAIAAYQPKSAQPLPTSLWDKTNRPGKSSSEYRRDYLEDGGPGL